MSEQDDTPTLVRRPTRAVVDSAAETAKQIAELEDSWRRYRSGRWTTSASGAPGTSIRARERGAGARWPPGGCRSWTTSSGRWSTPPPNPDRSSRASGRARQALDVLAAWAIPGGTTRPARRSTRPGTRRSDRRRRGRAPGTVAQVVRPGYGRTTRPAAGLGRGGDQGRVMAPGLLRGARGLPRRRPGRRSSGPTASWPARYHPDVNKDPGAEERFKEITEAYDVLSDPRPAQAVRRVRRGLPAGRAEVRPGRLSARARAYAGAGAGGGRPSGWGGGGGPSDGFRYSAAPGTSTSRTCSAASSAAAAAAAADGDRSPAPTRRPRWS